MSGACLSVQARLMFKWQSEQYNPNILGGLYSTSQGKNIFRKLIASTVLSIGINCVWVRCSPLSMGSMRENMRERNSKLQCPKWTFTKLKNEFLVQVAWERCIYTELVNQRGSVDKSECWYSLFVTRGYSDPQ